MRKPVKMAMVALAAIAISIAAVVPLSGCLHQQTPSEAAEEFMGALKSLDNEKIGEVYSGDDLLADDASDTYFSLIGGDDSSSDLSDDGKEAVSKMVSKMFAFDYAVTNESVDGDKATVDVDIKTYKMGKAIKKAVANSFSKAIVYAFSGDTDDDEMESIIYEEMSDAVDDLDKKDYEKTVTLDLEKTDDGWKVSKLDDDQKDAIFGGFISALESFGSVSSK